MSEEELGLAGSSRGPVSIVILQTYWLRGHIAQQDGFLIELVNVDRD